MRTSSSVLAPPGNCLRVVPRSGLAPRARRCGRRRGPRLSRRYQGHYGQRSATAQRGRASPANRLAHPEAHHRRRHRGRRFIVDPTASGTGHGAPHQGPDP
eukprot:5860151-Pyramimonas_sp.AAC.1